MGIAWWPYRIRLNARWTTHRHIVLLDHWRFPSNKFLIDCQLGGLWFLDSCVLSSAPLYMVKSCQHSRICLPPLHRRVHVHQPYSLLSSVMDFHSTTTELLNCLSLLVTVFVLLFSFAAHPIRECFFISSAVENVNTNYLLDTLFSIFVLKNYSWSTELYSFISYHDWGICKRTHAAQFQHWQGLTL